MKIIFEQALSDEMHNILMEKINENDNFSITFENFAEFFSAKQAVNILNDKKIDYKIMLDDKWSETKKCSDYSIIGKILINDIDYEAVQDSFPIFDEIKEASENQNEDAIISYKDSSL